MGNEVFVVGVAGGSGSGKSTLTDNLMRRFGDKICLVHHDNYYRAHNDLTYEERTKLNYDEPASLETELMVEQLALLKQGRSVRCPVYDFTVHNRSDKTELLEPKPIILVEGILIFAEPKLVEQMDLRIFVDTDADVRILRRAMRDVEERGRSLDSVVRQYLTTVKPMHEQFVEPTRKYADIIVLEGGHNLVALDMIMQRIAGHIAES